MEADGDPSARRVQLRRLRGRLREPVAAEFFIVAGLTASIDQLTKLCVIENFRPGDMGQVPIVQIWRNENLGIADGLLSTASPWVITGITAAILAGLATVTLATGRTWIWLPSGLGFGGVISNLADRLTRGAVTDFLVLPSALFDGTNIADLAILAGMVGLAALFIREASRL